MAKLKKLKYHQIPPNEILPEIRELAVAWADQAYFHIWDKHKLATDIQNLFEQFLNELYTQVKHGDEEHQLWLKNKFQEFLKNKSK